MDVGFWEAHKKPFCFFMDNLRLLYFLRYTTYKKRRFFNLLFYKGNIPMLLQQSTRVCDFPSLRALLIVPLKNYLT